LQSYRHSPYLISLEEDLDRLPDSAGGIFHAGARLAVERLLGEVGRFLSGIAPKDLRIVRFGPGEEVEEERFESASRCTVCGSFAKDRSEVLG
jgi:hypothetical protein